MLRFSKVGCALSANALLRQPPCILPPPYEEGGQEGVRVPLILIQTYALKPDKAITRKNSFECTDHY